MLPLWGVVSSVLFSVRISVVIQRQKTAAPAGAAALHTGRRFCFVFCSEQLGGGSVRAVKLDVLPPLGLPDDTAVAVGQRAAGILRAHGLLPRGGQCQHPEPGSPEQLFCPARIHGPAAGVEPQTADRHSRVVGFFRQLGLNEDGIMSR